jgi:hypothetical protein
LVPPPGHNERAQQQRLHPRRENRVARLDGERKRRDGGTWWRGVSL